MAKKQYGSPEMKVCALDCKDVITTSGIYYAEERTVVASFNKDWLV